MELGVRQWISRPRRLRFASKRRGRVRSRQASMRQQSADAACQELQEEGTFKLQTYIESGAGHWLAMSMWWKAAISEHSFHHICKCILYIYIYIYMCVCVCIYICVYSSCAQHMCMLHWHFVRSNFLPAWARMRTPQLRADLPVQAAGEAADGSRCAGGSGSAAGCGGAGAPKGVRGPPWPLAARCFLGVLALRSASTQGSFFSPLEALELLPCPVGGCHEAQAAWPLL